MDAPQHAVDGYLITQLCAVAMGVTSLPSWAALGGALVGALPDAVGEAERLIKRNRTLWGWYDAAHNGWLAKILQYLPQYGYHLFKDRHSHVTQGAPRNWYAPPGLSFWEAVKAMKVDWIGWATTGALALIVLAVRLWRLP